MPLYEYECEPNGHRFEKIQKYSDPPIAACPVCGGTVRKLFSSPAIQFKGSGWYITDYARAGKSDDGGKTAPAKDGQPAASSQSPSESSSKSTESTSDSKSESKPAKTETQAPAKSTS
jgi:putative FmdB family regulatory protein